MNRERTDAMARAVLYEGYMLYPYRRSSLKNQHRWMFGTLYPTGYEEVVRGTERDRMHIESLLAGDRPVNGRLRFLHVAVDHGGECKEQSFDFEIAVSDSQQKWPFSFPPAKSDNSCDPRIKVKISCARKQIDRDLVKLVVEVANDSQFHGSDRDAALSHSLLSCQVMLMTHGASFVSLVQPPEELREAAADCRNDGCYPVLLGEEVDHDVLLCSPIMLYDHPQIAPESASDFFDSTEMDEMLTLRLLTLSEGETQDVTDQRARELLERTHATAREQLMKTHGAVRNMRRLDDR
jgi:hypothetical protein